MYKRQVLSRPVSPGGDRVSDWKVWNVEKNLLERASKRIISGVGNFYHSTWVDAIAGGNPFNPIRLYWQMHRKTESKQPDMTRLASKYPKFFKVKKELDEQNTAIQQKQKQLSAKKKDCLLYTSRCV